MPRRADDAGGPAFFRLYRAAERRPTEDEFADLCRSAGVDPPSHRMFGHLRRLYEARKPHYIPMNTLDVELKARSETWTLLRMEGLVADRRRERPNLEFKARIDAQDKDAQTKKPWAAMANSGGGTVVYGVQESDTVASRLRPLKLVGLEERFAQENERIDPPTNQTVHLVPADEGVGYAAVTVRPAAAGVVHLVDGRAPKRVGTTTSFMSSEEIRRWHLQGERPST
jgi:hypothetical protein